MKRIGLFIVFLLAIFIAQSSVVFGQSPDPTGRGRYLVVGGERSLQGAEMVTSLPPGASCNPAGELVGGQFLNSIGAGKANQIELSSNAQVAVAPDGRQFLCKCGASGKFFNRIFPIEEQQPAAQPQAQRASYAAEPASQDQKQAQVIHVNLTMPQPPAQQTPPPTPQKQEEKKCGFKCQLGKFTVKHVIPNALSFTGGYLLGNAGGGSGQPSGRNTQFTGGNQ